MRMNDVIGLLDCHTSPELGELTSARPLASTSFLGRYAFCDFALSNFCNSEVPTVGILVRDHERSMMKHLGDMGSWVTNTKTDSETILYNERGALNPAYNTDINNIRENDWVLYDSQASYLVFAPAHMVLSIDLRPIIEEHIARNEAITVVYKKAASADREFLSEDVLEIGDDGYLVSAKKNDGTQKKADVSLSIWVVTRTVLAEMIRRHAEVDASYGMREMIAWVAKKGIFKVHTHEYKGFVRCFDSLKHYVDYSFELLDQAKLRSLFLDDWPIYTQTHDTPPALFGTRGSAENSFIANGCVIEGSVKDSIVSRNVRIGKGAKVERSIVLSGVAIGEGASISDVVLDKYSVVTRKHAIAGDPENVIYMKQGAIL